MHEQTLPAVSTNDANQQRERMTFWAGLRCDIGLIAMLWRREMMHLFGERSRWFGLILQPLLFWLIIGSGIARTFTLNEFGEISYLTYFYPGTLMMMVLFTTIFAMISVIEDRQNGFLQGVLTAPGSRTAMVLGKITGVTSLASIQAAIYILVAPFAGFSLLTIHWPALVLTLLLTCVGLGAVNFLMAWTLRSSQAFHALMSLILMPLWLVSGAMFPVPQVAWLKAVMVANPLSYSVWAFHAAMSGGHSPVAYTSLGTSLAVLTLFAAVFLGLCVWVSRKGTGAHKH